MDSQAEKARRYFDSALDAYMRDKPNASVAEVRQFTLDLLGVALPNFTDLTETLSCDFFDEIAEECGFDGERARLYDTTDYDIVEEKVRYLAQFLADNDPVRFRREVSDMTHFFCKRAALANMEANCRAQKVWWARVPTGNETCAFCFMLASRGFAYVSEKTASEGRHGYHNHCDCVAVPGFKGKGGNPLVKIDGYDPKTMSDNLSKCEQAIGGRKALEEQWKQLPDEEKAKWLDRHRKPNGDINEPEARKAYVDNQVMREVETRDWHWLYTGEEPKIDYSRRPRSDYGKFRSKSKSFNPADYEESNIIDKNVNEWRDLFAHDSLKHSGFRVAPREPKALNEKGVEIDGITVPDIEIDGVIWEVKSVRNGDHKPKNELSFIEQTIRDARDNFKNPYDVSKKSGMGDMRSETRVVISTRYRNINATNSEVEEEFRKRAERYRVDVLWIDANGSVRRFKGKK